jgi:hypothetical protein
MVLAIDGYGQALKSIELYQLSERSQQPLEMQQQQSRINPDLDMNDLSESSNVSTAVNIYQMEIYGPLYTYNRVDKCYDCKHRFIKNKEASKSKSLLQAALWNPVASQQSADYPYATFVGAAGGFPINSTRSSEIHTYFSVNFSIE